MSLTAFHRQRRISTGSVSDIALFLKGKPQGDVLVFDDSTGRQIDFDSTGTADEIALRDPDRATRRYPRHPADRDRIRAAQEAAYRFISAIGGNLPEFEEATRALFAYDRRRFGDLIANWPEDVRDYAIKLAFADQNPGPA